MNNTFQYRRVSLHQSSWLISTCKLFSTILYSQWLTSPCKIFWNFTFKFSSPHKHAYLRQPTHKQTGNKNPWKSGWNKRETTYSNLFLIGIILFHRYRIHVEIIHVVKIIMCQLSKFRGLNSDLQTSPRLFNVLPKDQPHYVLGFRKRHLTLFPCPLNVIYFGVSPNLAMYFAQLLQNYQPYL